MYICISVGYAYTGEVCKKGFSENTLLCALLEPLDVSVDDGEVREDEVLEVLDGGLAEFTQTDDHTDGVLAPLGGGLRRGEEVVAVLVYQIRYDEHLIQCIR